MIPFSTIEDCWKNTIQGMITAPMLAETRSRYFGIGDRESSAAPEAISARPGWASTATRRKTSSNAPTAIAIRSTVE